MLSNSIDIYGTSITSALPHVKSGKFRVLGVMDSQRLSQVPDAPTFKEQGYDFNAPLRYYLSVPGATPKDVIDKLSQAINQVIADPAFVERARAVGWSLAGRSGGHGQVPARGDRPLGTRGQEPEHSEGVAIAGHGRCLRPCRSGDCSELSPPGHSARQRQARCRARLRGPARLRDAERGFIATLPEAHIDADAGGVSWTMKSYGSSRATRRRP
jgi:hypothetical protein